MLLPDGSSWKKFGSFSGQEQAPHRSLDRIDQLRRILAALQVVCNLFRRKALLVCWLEVIFNINESGSNVHF